MFKKIMPLLLLATLFLFGVHPASAVTSYFQPITNPDKSWTITFNADVSEQADLNSIYIQSADNVKHEASINLSADSRQIIVQPLKPYRFGTKYTLVVPKGLESANGKRLKEDVTKQFELESTYIKTIQANSTSWLTNVMVESNGPDIARVTVSMEGFPEVITLHRSSNQFSRGILSLAPGQTLIIHAYDQHEQLLETQYYDVK